MTIHVAILKHSEEIADGTMAFHFSKPANFSFKPGQAIDLILGDPKQADVESMRHAFSIVSAPFENTLTVATRMRDSAYKRSLKSLRPGASVQIDGSFGSLTLHNNRERPAVLIAGGIGITPFMSMLRQATQDQLPQRLLLLYSNRRPEDAAFLQELQDLERRNKNFSLIATMTEISLSNRPWNGATGLIDAPLITSITGELRSPIYYLVGPPKMVETMKSTLNRIGIDDDDIRSEEFYGY